MPNPALSTVVARVGRVAHRLTRPDPDDTDGRLLARFVRTGEDAAFAELVRRLGPMVLGVCRRVSGDAHLADDAFQAAFLVLARRAADVRPREAVRGWLYGVAVRTAREARAVSARRRTREVPVPTLPDRPASVRPPADPDALAALDEEVAALPEHLRAAVVLCELDGASRKDAAARLGVPEGTLSSRLAKARKLLAARLRQRGVALSAAGLTALLGRVASANVPADLAARAVSAAVATGPVPAAVAVLSHGVIRAMFVQKLKVVPVVLLLVVVTLAGGWLLAADLPTDPPAAAAQPPAGDPPTAAPQQPSKAADPRSLPKGPNKILLARHDRLTLIDPDGKNEKGFLAGDAVTPSFIDGVRLSPDGRRVAFIAHVTVASDHSGPVSTEPLSFGLYVAGAGDKEGQSLDVSPRSFAWSPDGAEVASTEFPPGQKKLSATHGSINVKTKQKTALKLPDDHYITDWSRDGKHLVTTRIWPGAGVFLMKGDGSEQQSLTEKRLPAGSYGLMGRLSPDGKRLLFTIVTPKEKGVRGEPKQDLAILDIDSGKVTPVADVPINGEIRSYCWSPDSKRIAYTWSEVLEGKPEDLVDKEIESQLVICDPDGKNVKTIASEKGKLITIVGVDWR
jgi:RNA polymerase sigma factor (sigma-70 family)